MSQQEILSSLLQWLECMKRQHTLWISMWLCTCVAAEICAILLISCCSFLIISCSNLFTTSFVSNYEGACYTHWS